MTTEVTFPIHLKALDVFRAAQAAFAEGKLGAQNGAEGCYYRDPENGSRCGVGAGFTDEQLNALVGEDNNQALPDSHLANESQIGTLIEKGFVTTDKPTLLQELQVKHDAIINRSVSAQSKAGRTTALKRYIDRQVAKLEGAA